MDYNKYKRLNKNNRIKKRKEKQLDKERSENINVFISKAFNFLGLKLIKEGDK